MRLILIILFTFFLAGCKKHKDCTQVVVTLTAPSCSHVGVIINDIKYPTDDLPPQYAVEGKIICIEYSFYEDLRLCACCGGTRVHVVSVR
jgi:hypothetical protein